MPVYTISYITSILLLAISLSLASPVHACSYGKFGLEAGDGSQTTVDGLFQGIYQKQKTYKTQDWRREAKDLAVGGAAASTDIIERLGYAWALHRGAENEQALAIYQDILKTTPNHYETLCSYATTLHNLRQYPQAAEILKKAIAQKPRFRNMAEEFHLAMIDYQAKSRNNYKYAQDNVFVDSLTPIWKNRKTDPEQNFSTATFPEGYKSEGMAELLRQYPEFGEAWFVLGMLLEHEEDFSMAVKAYDRALQYGTAHAPELKNYLVAFREFGRSHDTGRLVGKRVIQLGIGLAVLVVLLWILRVVNRVVADITSARASKEERRRLARKKFKDPDSPL